MTIQADDVIKMAHLARLAISDKEIPQYVEQLSKIFSWIDQLNQINTEGVEPLAHSFPMELRLRDDVVTEVNEREALQKIAPLTEAGLYLVPAVIE